MSEALSSPQAQEVEIDLIALFKRLWDKRIYIIKVTGCFMVLGLLVALFSQKVFTASCVFVSQTSTATASSSLSSLASIAGINLGDMSNTEILSPKIYPQILNNVDFQKDLMYSKVKFDKWEEPITLFDYYRNDDYATITISRVLKKYTVGLPGVIMGAIRDEVKTAGSGESNLNYLTYDEYECAKELGNIISLDINDKGGYITISVNMPEPVAAAMVAQTTFDLLQKYITEFKLAKVQSNLTYIRERYDEAKSDFEAKQIAYAQYQDANRSLTTAVAKTKEEQLESEYSLANTIYTELAKQMLQANLKVKEDTPMLTAVKPVTVPTLRSKPQRARLLVIWTFFGGIIGCGLVFGFDWLKNEGSKWPKTWNV